MAKNKIADYISEWMEPFGSENGYELSRTEFVKEGQDWFLRVYVDKIEGDGYGYMSSDDCEAVSRYLSEKLDESDPIKQNYYLEVSSPGLDRPLLSEKDFTRFKGGQIEIKLYEPIDGQKFLEGELVEYKDETVTIKDNKGTTISVPISKTAKVNLAVVF